MVNRSKAKGTAAETAVVNWLRGFGFEEAERLALRGNLDAGDVRVYPGIHLEVKAGAAAAHPSLGQVVKWRNEAAVEGRNANAACYLITKRAGSTDPGTWPVHLTLQEFRELASVRRYLGVWAQAEPVVITLRGLVALLPRPTHPQNYTSHRPDPGGRMSKPKTESNESEE